jgi:hypothetical protein
MNATKIHPLDLCGTAACVALLLGCSKTGTIDGVAMSDCHGEDDLVSLVIKLDDGSKVNASRGKDNNGGVITGGQKVRLKKGSPTKSGAECWEIVEWLKP